LTWNPICSQGPGRKTYHITGPSRVASNRHSGTGHCGPGVADPGYNPERRVLGRVAGLCEAVLLEESKRLSSSQPAPHHLDHVVDPDGHIVAQVAYTDGRVTGLTDADGATTGLSYDLDNLSETIIPPAVDGVASPSSTISFDALGNVAGTVDALGRVAWSDDAPIPGHAADGTNTRYDADGRVVGTLR
jgi:YD repeat-containing protein